MIDSEGHGATSRNLAPVIGHISMYYNQTMAAGRTLQSFINTLWPVNNVEVYTLL